MASVKVFVSDKRKRVAKNDRARKQGKPAENYFDRSENGIVVEEFKRMARAGRTNGRSQKGQASTESMQKTRRGKKTPLIEPGVNGVGED